MSLILVAGSSPGAGATTVAVGLAHRLAYAGHTVRVERLGGDERAAGDAAVFSLLEFATSSGQPLDASALAAAGAAEGMTVAEAPAGGDAAGIARDLGGSLLLVSVDGGAEGGALVGATVLTNHAFRAGRLAVPEDRLLAAPTVGALIEASHARVLARSVEGDASLCEHIVVGPISEDANDPHFRRFPRKAVVTRAEKVDIALSALRTDTRCLILTGGADPSPYLIDRVASDRNTTLLLAPGGTVETVRDIEATFGASAFSGEEKVERAGALMAAALTDEDVARLLG